jgi:hypothetical protein
VVSIVVVSPSDDGSGSGSGTAVSEVLDAEKVLYV